MYCMVFYFMNYINFIRTEYIIECTCLVYNKPLKRVSIVVVGIFILKAQYIFKSLLKI